MDNVSKKNTRKLTQLVIDRVDLCKMGANFDLKTGDGAHILLMKSADAPVTSADDANAPTTTAFDFSSLTPAQAMRVFSAVLRQIDRTVPGKTIEQKIALVQTHAPGLWEAYNESLARPDNPLIATAAQARDAAFTKIGAEADRLVVAGNAPTREQAIAKMMRENHPLVREYAAADATTSSGITKSSGGTAFEKMQTAAKELVAAGKAPTIQAGLALVTKTMPGLAAEYDAEFRAGRV